MVQPIAVNVYGYPVARELLLFHHLPHSLFVSPSVGKDISQHDTQQCFANWKAGGRQRGKSEDTSTYVDQGVSICGASENIYEDRVGEGY